MPLEQLLLLATLLLLVSCHIHCFLCCCWSFLRFLLLSAQLAPPPHSRAAVLPFSQASCCPVPCHESLAPTHHMRLL